ncbi:unnamed protein product [Psylliodes chrysocephalus]|uniref:Uncharacterized protein n=1 Tax=Psylliodes chrysocephalus TaxID=3402493 RepID=A0A9P0G5A0_9CUCU|nr:unnamed protein product [Psylliodes chrysocephala]
MMFKITNSALDQTADSVVKIEYGPYEAHGVITHRAQRLYGLIKHLTDLGFEIEIRQMNLLNRLEIIMYKRKIFQCNITNMKFNMISEYDPVCLRAVAAVKEAASRMKPIDENSEQETEKNDESNTN